MQNKIRQLRVNKRLKTNVAIKKLKISYSFLNKIERGERKPGRDLISKMSKLYDCSIDEIYKILNEVEYKC